MTIISDIIDISPDGRTFTVPGPALLKIHRVDKGRLLITLEHRAEYLARELSAEQAARLRDWLLGVERPAPAAEPPFTRLRSVPDIPAPSPPPPPPRPCANQAYQDQRLAQRQAVLERLEKYRREHPGATWRQCYEAIPHHYRNYNSFVTSMFNAMNNEAKRPKDRKTEN